LPSVLAIVRVHVLLIRRKLGYKEEIYIPLNASFSLTYGEVNIVYSL
jgi:hypothetical protein